VTTRPAAGDAAGGAWGGCDERAVQEILARASSASFGEWWALVEHAGFCASPIHLTAHDPAGSARSVMTRCKNRRAGVCSSCARLYAGDTWQLVHAGIAGGHHGLPESIRQHPAVFATLTAPSYGPVHTTRPDGTLCHPAPYRGMSTECGHGRTRSCGQAHELGDELLGQPLCLDCYDYVGHVLFAWHAPELWHRFTIRLRRLVARQLRQAGENPKAVRVSYVKVVEQQRRLIPHFHTVIRLDARSDRDHPVTPPATSLGAEDLAAIVGQAASTTTLTVPDPEGSRVLRFGTQTDIQPLTAATKGTGAADDGVSEGRKVAAYLAKYVTKSVAETGIGPRRISDQAVPLLDVDGHTRRVLETITGLASHDEYAGLVRWLHTLAYRGHITSKTRAYSTTMGALRAQRAAWRTTRDTQPDQTGPARAHSIGTEWEFVASGHATTGDRLLAVTAATKAAEAHRIAREELASPASDED
jgi:hypothetical protein